ncbi:MAG: hypothetical protein KKE42_12795 [Alphaproteobacteria bacterium]|uniref:hypothetical protein n=1 Tax=Brevundimonas sp. TaxID=1871086 RepID=UPI0018462A48|nr:hypothetical protein [Brevundimonas sp.]MBU3971260.1 hypothetical protein [Alphaproteobacteria bacterium]MBA3048874.1 hypothetical protein [Brevundimonas sp.]MBU3974661.1 hypothetical protein [Alphaproteobacteria bacterium]MBU4038423.1 hypothetical protein [Alphaproteobacteria bacterium]MBU4136794.1 hypothetical protein [Alphaproteobacteria bacterium]
MTRTYLIHGRLSIALEAAFSGVASPTDHFGDEASDISALMPDGVIEVAAEGDAFLFAHSSPHGPNELLADVQLRLSDLPVEGLAVLEIGPRCKTTEVEPDEDDWERLEWRNFYLLEKWLDDGRMRFDVRQTFGPKALFIVAEGGSPGDLWSVRQLRKALPQASPHWHGRNSLLLALRTDEGVAQLWQCAAVQRVAEDPRVSFVGCFEIGPVEAALHEIELVLPGCNRHPSPPRSPRNPKLPETRTVAVEIRHRAEKSGGQPAPVRNYRGIPPGSAAKAPLPHMPLRVSHTNTPPTAANDDLAGANDNANSCRARITKSSRAIPRRSRQS